MGLNRVLQQRSITEVVFTLAEEAMILFNPSVTVLIYSDMSENVQSFKRKREREREREREKIKEREKEREREREREGEREREWIDLMLYAKER